MFLLIGQWFALRSVGGGLLLAGLRQAVQPRFTAENIPGIKGKDALRVVQEPGFANISIGATDILSSVGGSWVLPASIAGCPFYGFAGSRHVAKPGTKRA